MNHENQVRTPQPARAAGEPRAEAPSRRDLLKAGAVVVAAGAAGAVGIHTGTVAAQVDSPTLTPEELCVLTPELTEGPYYLDTNLVRQDITEGRPGVPLRLQVTVNDPATCSPLANAAVDIWHCDAQGFYSGVNANSPGSDAEPEEIAEAAASIFLRGIQLTDADGVAEFLTIYPGWYRGRTVHIHLMVHFGGAPEGTSYDGGNIAHIGQLFFDDAISDQVFLLDPYAGRPEAERTTNDEDGIIADHEDEPGFMVALAPVTEGMIADGFGGTIALGVDPNA